MSECYEYKTLIGSASCGLFGIQEDYEESGLSLDELMSTNDVSTFYFKAQGNSMEPTIFPGDILIVDTSKKPTHGRVVVCELNGERFCKRLFLNSGSRLVSDNQHFKPIPLTKDMDFRVFGVVTGIARKL